MAGFSNPDAYELWMGRWSRRVAPLFVRFADPPNGGLLLDVGSGTGALAKALIEASEDVSVIGIEPSEEYVAYCRERNRDERLRFEVGDGQDIAFDDDSFDAALALLVLQVLPDAATAVEEMVRVTRPGGVVATSQWDFVSGLPMLALFWQSAIEIIDTDDARARAARSMVVDYPDQIALKRLWRRAGLVDVNAERLEIAMTFAGFEDYWRPFETGVSPSASYVATLAGDQREALKQRLRDKTLNAGSDRPFALPALAWSIRGTVPR